MAKSNQYDDRRAGDASPARSIDQFCDLVRADPALQEALRKPDDPEQFIALVLTTASEHGFTFGADDVRAAMQGRLPGASALLDVGDRETQLPPQGWLPVGAFWRDGQLYLQWSFFGRQRLSQPFFEGDVQCSMFRPFNRLIRYATPISRLAEWLRLHPSLRPNGFIFHMSRCGSTQFDQLQIDLAGNLQAVAGAAYALRRKMQGTNHSSVTS
jgi:hypothetical protein